MDIKKLLKSLLAYKASSLHLKVGVEPIIRVDKSLKHLNLPVIDTNTLEELSSSLISEELRFKFKKEGMLFFAFELSGIGRFNATYKKSIMGLYCIFTLIPIEIPKLNQYGMPIIVKELLKHKKGIIIVSGAANNYIFEATASMINECNETLVSHIMTLESTINFVHTSKSSMVTQIDYNYDFDNFSDAFNLGALNYDINILYIDKLDTYEKVQSAIYAAEMGCLVITTMHLSSAEEVLERIVYTMPADHQELVRTQLSNTLQAIITQTIVPTIEGKQIGIHEVMLNNRTISNIIKNQSLTKITPAIKSFEKSTPMQVQASELLLNIENKIITQDVAIEYSNNSDELRELIEDGK